jgi:predicted anti-sigma-YlaC factor YlaD
MRCQQFQEALSARLDGEDPVVAPAELDRHVATCAACAAYAAGIGVVHRRSSVRPAETVPDLSARILAALPDPLVPAPTAARTPAPAAPGGSHWSRWALLVVGLTQLVVSLPPMLFGEDANAPVHVARELGAWDLALAAALLLVVARPRHASGLVPFAATLAVAMVGAAVVDLLSGRAGVAESQHLLELSGLALLWVIARRPVDDRPLLDGLRRPRPALA